MKTMSLINPAGHLVHKGGVLALILLFAIMFAPLNLFAQHGKMKHEKMKGVMADSAHHEPYNLSTVETIRGTVTRIDQLPGRMEGMVGIHAILDVGAETITVHFGPYSYISKQSTKINEGDEIEVTGSRITHEGEPAILAAEVKHGDEVLMLRDKKGKPLWRGHGKSK